MRPALPKAAGCCGCELCAALCPKEAIQMQPDAEGFLYPEIDETLCNGCGLCTKRCPALSPPAKISHNLAAYGGGWLGEEKLRQSASGGAASALAEATLAAGGVVYGAAYAPGFRAAHYLRVTSREGLAPLKSSKYIQARKNGVYRQVLWEMRRPGRKVLFVGLPCEAAALRAFLQGRESEGLLICELFCYGVGSPKVGQLYLDRLEADYGSEITAFSVRHKKDGWTPAYLRAVFRNGKEHLGRFYQTDYGYAFTKMARPSCYQCRFKGEHRVADLSLGDFWGLSPQHPGYNPLGVSAILANTPNGVKALQTLPGDFYLFETTPLEILRHNPIVQASRPADGRAEYAARFVREGLFPPPNGVYGNEDY